MSLVDPLACGFVKCYVYNNLPFTSGSNTNKSKFHHKFCDEFNARYTGIFEAVTYDEAKKFPNIKSLMDTLKKRKDSMIFFIAHFLQLHGISSQFFLKKPIKYIIALVA